MLGSPNGIVAAIADTGILTDLTASAPGFFKATYAVNKRLNSPPNAEVTCTAGTPMTARLSKIGTAINTTTGMSNGFMAGSPGASQSGTLGIGMLMGIASFAGVTGASAEAGTTYGLNGTTSVSATATGSGQPLNLTVAIYANSNQALTSAHAGLWTYGYNVNLDF